MPNDLRQLDAEVAECLGWHDIGWRVKASHLPPIFSGIDPDGVLRDVPEFSSCPLACESVKQAVLAKGWTWGLDVFYKTNGVEFRCLVFKGKNTSDSESVGTTEYEAVCRAYVAAVKGGSNGTNPR